jgi:endonuclease YncB( thermonuclease family)
VAWGRGGRRSPWSRLLAPLVAALIVGVLVLRDRQPAEAPGAPPPVAPPAGGVATVIDGDTIVLAGERIRLSGIDAPETAQTCDIAGRAWPCGAEARQALDGLLRGRPVRCAAEGRDQYGRLLAQCHVGADDIGGVMVRLGWAVAYTRYSQRYVAQEAAARQDRIGLWRGRFETPEDWRRRHPR